MSLNYSPANTPAVNSNSITRRMFHPTEIPEESISLFTTDAVPVEPGESSTENLLNHEPEATATNENMSYAPDRKFNFSSPVGETDRDITPPVSELDRDVADEPIIHHDDADPESVISDADDELVPSQVVDYYNESALSTKTRNALPDDVFGLPRTRQYPLNDRSHVIQAVRMFKHCKDPEDKKILASNIIKAMEKFDIDIYIGKENPLYSYLPKSLQEAVTDTTPVMDIVLKAIGIEKKRTKEDVIRDHLSYNAQFYNNVFYNKEYATNMVIASGIKYLDYFYPNMITHNFYTRLHTSIGGIGLNESIYKDLHIRSPLETDYTKPLGWCKPEQVTDFDIIVQTNYNQYVNWFKVDLSDDIDHIFYCARLYSILGEIINNPKYDDSSLSEMHHAMLADWYQRMHYHYEVMRSLPEDTNDWYREIQYLHDLLWNFMDNPYSDDDKAKCISALLSAMATSGGSDTTMIDKSMVTKADCAKYLVTELGLEDDIFLLPSYMEYPILNKASVKLAMDCIRRVEKEYPDDVAEYVKRLNRKYSELGCTFSITPDHPYAQYASKPIIDKMVYILVEGDTAVSDQGTSAEFTGMEAGQPWYKRLDYIGSLHRDGSENKELGPNKKPMQKPDYTQTDSFL